MKFGLLYIPDYSPERYKSASHYYGEMIEQIQCEEELGFEGVFFAEHYVGGYAFPSPPVFAAAVAQRTKRIRLGTGVTLLPLSNPVRLAEEYAMVDVLSDGRLDFGIGRGVLKAEYELFDIDEAESHGRFHEAIEIIRQAWTQETVTYDGKYYKVRDVKALPKPVQQPHPPIWSACAVTPESFTWAGSDGLQSDDRAVCLSQARATAGQARFVLEGARGGRSRSENPRGAGRLSPLRRGFGRRGARAGGQTLRPVLAILRSLDRKSFESADYKEYKGGLSKLFGDATYDDLDKGDCVIFGTPERCVQRLKRAQKDYRLDYPIFEVNFGGFPHKETLKSLKKFAKYVMPHFK